MLRLLPLALLATPAAAHPTTTAHVHGETSLLVAAGVALVVTALGVALARARG